SHCELNSEMKRGRPRKDALRGTQKERPTVILADSMAHTYRKRGRPVYREMVGAGEEEDPTDVSHMENVWRAVKQINEAKTKIPYKGEHFLIPIKVISASSQQVAGTLWRYEVLVGESECTRNTIPLSEISEKKCLVKEEGCRWMYSTKRYVREWEGTEEFTIEMIREVRPNEKF
ncbi:hypothetical protein PMAYCL1PPCAC_22686, partial [Pristionchus mayeri]